MNLEQLDVKHFKNQYLFFENYQKINLNKIRNELKTYFEAINQDIFLSLWRKK